MASMEQLQMLDDDDSTTSSSEDENLATTTSNGESKKRDWSNHDESNADIKAEASPTPKKRIKLSLGGKFKAVLSSPTQKLAEQQPKQTKDIPTMEKDSEKSTTAIGNESTVKKTVSKSPKITLKKSMLPLKKDPAAVPTAPKLANKSKINAKPAVASASGTNNKPNEVKKRPTLKLPTSSLAKPAPMESSAPPAQRGSASSSLRSIRITPMSSPGLLLNLRGEAGTAHSVFTQTMATAGYTTEARTKNPHRGSSVQRTVDDLFDSDVKFCARFPKLVPDDLVVQSSSVSDPSASIIKAEPESTWTQDPTATASQKEDLATTLMNRLRNALQPKTNDETPDSIMSSENGSDNAPTDPKKRSNRIPQYSDMIPISLSLTYPEQYTQKRLEYVKKVNEREKAIIEMQEKQHEALLTDPMTETKMNTNDIPPIPIPPDVPTRDELRRITNVEEIFGSQDQQQQNHPLYIPKNKELVKHLDENCFRAIDGRYFGLSSNAIADPYFFGPNAPGIIGGLTFSASTGLATASSGGGAAFGSLLFTMPTQPSSASTTSSAPISKTVPVLTKKPTTAPTQG